MFTALYRYIYPSGTALLPRTETVEIADYDLDSDAYLGRLVKLIKSADEETVTRFLRQLDPTVLVETSRAIFGMQHPEKKKEDSRGRAQVERKSFWSDCLDPPQVVDHHHPTYLPIDDMGEYTRSEFEGPEATV
jgi:hypothetical protein